MIKCEDCGEFLIGDAVETPIRCPNVPEEEWSLVDLDSDFLFCGATNDE